MSRATALPLVATVSVAWALLAAGPASAQEEGGTEHASPEACRETSGTPRSDPEAGSTASRVAGEVVDADTRRAVPGLVVHLGGIDGPEARTDARGRFDLGAVRPGRFRLGVRGPGYGRQDGCIVVPAGQEVRVALALHPEPIPLEPLAVTVEGARPLWLVRAGFYRRMRAGGGVFITEQDIREKDPSRLSEMFSGEAAVSVASGNPEPMQALQATHPPPGAPGRPCPLGNPDACRRPQDTGSCPIQFLVDGRPVPLVLGIDTFHARDVAGIEAYFHASDIPPQFNVGRAACGVVNIWLKLHPGRPG